MTMRVFPMRRAIETILKEVRRRHDMTIRKRELKVDKRQLLPRVKRQVMEALIEEKETRWRLET